MWIVIFFIATVLILKALIDYRRPSKFPPGPRGLPLVGNIFNVKKLVNETKYYSHAWCRLADQYGPVVGLRLGIAEPLIIVSGRDAIVEMLNRSEFDGRPDGFLYRHRTGGIRRGLMFTDGAIWSDHRRFTMKTLRRFGFGKNTMEDMILHDAVRLTNVVAKLSKEGPINNLPHFVTLSVISSLWSIITGTRIDVEEGNPKVQKVVKVLQDAIRSSNVVGGIINQFPFLRHFLPGVTGFTTFNKRLAHMNRFFTDVITEHKAEKKEDSLKNFIDVYLAEIKEQEANPSLTVFDENQLMCIIKDLFSAGVDTTNNTIGFSIAFLTVNQDIQKKVHEEIDRVIGKDAFPTLADKIRLPYLSATLSEVYRMANVGPTSIPHRAMVDSTLLGFKIKKNYTLLANFRSVHMDRNHWGDPEVFRPERFLNEKGEYMEDPWVVPFGLGHRRCPGENVAKLGVFIFVTCLLQRFHFVLPEEHPKLCLDGIDGFTLGPPKMNLIAIDRHV